MKRHLLLWWRLFWLWRARVMHRNRPGSYDRGVRVYGFGKLWCRPRYGTYCVQTNWVAYSSLGTLRNMACAAFLEAAPEMHLWGPTRYQSWKRRLARVACWLSTRHTYEWGSYRCQRCGG